MVAACVCGDKPSGYGGILVDSELGVVQRNGRRARLTRREFEVFVLLFARRGRPLTIAAMHFSMTAHMPDADDISWNAIETYLSRLRKKLSGLPLIVETHWGRGYALRDPEQISVE